MSPGQPAISSDVGTKLLSLHASLDRAAIPHGFGGAIALAYAVAEPRATIDIDVNIAVPVGAARRVLDSLPAGVVGRPDVLDRIAREGQDRLRWGNVPVDLFFPQHEFHGVVAGRTIEQPFGNTVIPVIAPTDLAVFKALFNRRKDWADIEAMLLAGAVDIPESARWLRTIVGDDHPTVRAMAELVAEVEAGAGPATEFDPNVWRPGP